MNDLDSKIEKALSAGALYVWFQPIYNRETGTFDAAEALMRLYNGDEMLPTLASICRMEENGKIIEAGQLIFEKVCVFMGKYQELIPPCIHINLSCCQMRDMRNADAMIDTAKRHGISPGKIKIQSKKAETILNGVFHMAKSVDCEPIVEGIEDASQINREFLLGVRYFQGNAFAKAMPEEEYVRFLQNHASFR